MWLTPKEKKRGASLPSLLEAGSFHVEGIWEVGKRSFPTLSLSGPHVLTGEARMI